MTILGHRDLLKVDGKLSKNLKKGELPNKLDAEIHGKTECFEKQHCFSQQNCDKILSSQVCINMSF